MHPLSTCMFWQRNYITEGKHHSLTPYHHAGAANHTIISSKTTSHTRDMVNYKNNTDNCTKSQVTRSHIIIRYRCKLELSWELTPIKNPNSNTIYQNTSKSLAPNNIKSFPPIFALRTRRTPYQINTCKNCPRAQTRLSLWQRCARSLRVFTKTKPATATWQHPLEGCTNYTTLLFLYPANYTMHHTGNRWLCGIIPPDTGDPHLSRT